MRFPQAIALDCYNRGRPPAETETQTCSGSIRSSLLGSRSCESRAALGNRDSQMVLPGISHGGRRCNLQHRPSSDEAPNSPDHSA
jgi:hypothetical protein